MAVVVMKLNVPKRGATINASANGAVLNSCRKIVTSNLMMAHALSLTADKEDDMKLYRQVYINEYPSGLIRFIRERMIEREPIPVGSRYSSNIDTHISQRAGMFADSALTDGYGLIDLKRRERFVRMYGADDNG